MDAGEAGISNEDKAFSYLCTGGLRGMISILNYKCCAVHRDWMTRTPGHAARTSLRGTIGSDIMSGYL
ncbi:hypothetical protein GCM10020255_014240 [Rhodococcus baikonurensis]